MSTDTTKENEPKTNGTVFDVMGQTVEISAEELSNAIARQNASEFRSLVVEIRRLADATERQANATERIVKQLKPWAEREKRKNLLEQDPDYFEQVIKQVQAQRKAEKMTKKPKGKKQK